MLIDEITLEDPEALAEPYKQTITYKRDRAQQLLEFVCAKTTAIRSTRTGTRLSSTNRAGPVTIRWALSTPGARPMETPSS